MKFFMSFLFLISLFPIHPSQACTRFVYLGKDNVVVTGRSMDWKEDTLTNLWVLPRGTTRRGEAGKNSIKWTSKFGSVVATGYDISTTDGMNEKGLVANLLWLVESQYPNPASNQKTLSISLWAQYVLDNYATVKEAVLNLKKEPFIVITDKVPGQNRLATLHLSISDASGDSAIVEYIEGKMVIHHDSKYQVMTNSPTFDKQLALNEYWKTIGGTVMLPGTNRAADRFARASFYVQALPKVSDENLAVASAFSVIRNVSVPYGITTENEPNISSTRWRTVSDHKRQLYFFESVVTPNVFWVDLKKLDFSAKAPTLKLELGKDQKNIFSGEVSQSFKAALPFIFKDID